MTGSSHTASRHTAYLRSLFFFTSLLSTTYTRATITEAPAWHGQVTPGSDTTQSNRVPFTPYWVPFGSTSIDDDSPTIAYSPADAWSVKHGSGYIGPGAHTTDTPGAQLEYRFTGTGIEWYGSKGPTYGLADVSLDGRKPETVDLYAETEVHQQMLFYTDRLPTPTDEDDNADSAHAEHAIRIVALDAGNGKQRRHLNVDTFVVQGTGAQKSASRARKNRRTPLPVAVRPRPLSQDRMTTTDRQRMQRVRRLPPANTPPERRAWSGATRLVERGTTGINAMQFAVISDTQAIVIDKVEHNLLSVNGHPAWGAIYDFASHRVTAPLDLASNSFCAGGSWLGNGTLVNVGGNPVASDHTGAADFGDVNGLQAVRLFEPDQCQRDGDGCTMFEEPKRVRMAGARWYASVARLSDGSALIMGGSTKGGWINNQTTNNPSIEFFPPKAIHGSSGLPIHSPFLAETLNANLFPIVFALPDDRLFVAANRRAMIYSWRDNTEQELPGIPNGIRITYPMTAGSALLPLTPENGYTPEVLICGGSNVDDTRPADEISSQEPASDQCIRMVLERAGIERGWQVEHMPQARIMPDLVLLPGGEILIVNGAETGVAGYGNVKDQAGQSNADNPAYTPVLYDPSTSSFSSEGMPTSKIARMYHSVASLLPSGEVLLAGSNPNLDRTTASFPTEYRVETLAPPYVHQDRPTLAEVPDRMLYGKPFQVSVELPSGTKLKDVKVSLIDLGFVTHSVHMNTRLVGLKPSALSPDSKTLTIIGPPTPQIYPPGPGWLYVLVSGVPSEGRKVMVGDGASPPVDQAAIDNMLASTQTLAKDPKPKKQNKVADNRMKRVLRRR